MAVMHKRVAGLDVHKAVVACVRQAATDRAAYYAGSSGCRRKGAALVQWSYKSWRCRRHWRSIAPLWLLLSAAPVAADIIRWQELYSGFTMTQAQCAAIPQAVWVNPKGHSFCIRYYLSAAGGEGRRPVVFLGGDSPYASMADRYRSPPPGTHIDGLDTNALGRWADRISKEQQTTAIFLARVGLGGSSGTHHSLRHTMLELLATNAALDQIKQRYGFEGFDVYGHSGGGNLTAGLLELRNDIRCDVPAEGQKRFSHRCFPNCSSLLDT